MNRSLLLLVRRDYSFLALIFSVLLIAPALVYAASPSAKPSTSKGKAALLSRAIAGKKQPKELRCNRTRELTLVAAAKLLKRDTKRGFALLCFKQDKKGRIRFQDTPRTSKSKQLKKLVSKAYTVGLGAES